MPSTLDGHPDTTVSTLNIASNFDNCIPNRNCNNLIEVPILNHENRRLNNRNTRGRNAHNLIPIRLSKSGPSPAKVTPKCLVLNARSLVKPDAASSLCTEVTTNKIDVCFISETWLNSNVLSSLICPDGYALIRKDRFDARPVGGVAILCRKDWKINKLDYNDTVFECLWCKIQVKEKNKYYVAAIYNPPNPTYLEPDLLDYLSDCCEQILISDPGARIIIAGDVNHLRISEFSRQHNLEQLVKKPTRGQNTLDVFLTNYPYIWKSPTMFISLRPFSYYGFASNSCQSRERKCIYQRCQGTP